MKKISIIIILISILTNSYAQQHTISGYITDKNNGESIIGANIYSKLTGKGVTSNTYGFYSLTVEDGQQEIVYSFIGYKTISKVLNLQENINYDVEFSVDLNRASSKNINRKKNILPLLTKFKNKNIEDRYYILYQFYSFIWTIIGIMCYFENCTIYSPYFMHIYVSTSPTDGGIASSVAEAMACEVPVIITRFGDNEKWVKEETAGLLFDSGDVEELIECLIKLASNPELRREVGKRGRKVILVENNSEIEFLKIIDL
mgnify:CR=1 FL=1